MNLIVEAIQYAGYKLGTEVCLALDIAANELYINGKYNFNGEKNTLTNIELVEYYKKIM